MAIQQIHHDNDFAYGVRLFVCGNGEVLAGMAGAGSDPTGNGWRDETSTAFRALTTALVREKLEDYEVVSEFHAYNGGPRKAIIDCVWFRAELDEDGEPGEWVRVEKSQIPAEVIAETEKATDRAMDAFFETMNTEVETASN